MTDILTSILAIKPNAKVTVINEDVDNLVWEDGETPITKVDILAKQTELQAIYITKEYQRKRKEEYPFIVDQLDDIYHNGVDGWKTTIKAVKDKYPKS
tara:strand:+ start:545 stop:838 length:294 start_codon:yes stop_codon:yes gene_type:complete